MEEPKKKSGTPVSFKKTVEVLANTKPISNKELIKRSRNKKKRWYYF